MSLPRSIAVLLSGVLALSCADASGTGSNNDQTGGLTGSIAGRVVGPSIEGDTVALVGANVLVFRTHPCPDSMPPCPVAAVITAQTLTDSAGNYVLRNIPPERYTAVVNPPVNTALQSASADVTVESGVTTPLSFWLSRSGGTGDTTRTDTTQAKPVVMVAIQPNTLTLNVNDSAGVYAQLKAADSSVVSGRAVSWMVSDSTVLRLFPYGQSALFRALKSGAVTVTATSEGRTGFASVTVR